MDDKGYDEVCTSYRQLTEVRFKLLAFVPTIAGFAISLISNDLEAFAATPIPRLVVSLLGFVVTLGVIFYDQRNSQLYDALVERGHQLEKQLGIEATFSSRRPRTLKLFGVITIWHDRGLALIYGSVLAAWVFPVICGLLWSTNISVVGFNAPQVAVVITVMVAFVLIWELHRLGKPAD